MNADMHCHSTVSDGQLTPQDVVRRAAANGVTMLALTDHDETGGLDEAFNAAAETGLTLIAGVEISTSFLEESIHVVGLNIDHRNSTLLDGLAKIREGRHRRAVRIGESFDKIGIRGTLEGAQRFARNPELVSRAHFARFLVASGISPHTGAVFQNYLVRGKPGFVEHQWIDIAQAVAWIRGAGGIAVLAHPGRYRRLSNEQMGRLLDYFVAHGGEAIEVVSGAHSDKDILQYATIARRRNLLASRASDFHAPEESPVDLGQCPALPPDLLPVWSRWGASV